MRDYNYDPYDAKRTLGDYFRDKYFFIKDVKKLIKNSIPVTAVIIGIDDVILDGNTAFYHLHIQYTVKGQEYTSVYLHEEKTKEAAPKKGAIIDIFVDSSDPSIARKPPSLAKARLSYVLSIILVILLPIIMLILIEISSFAR